MREVQTEVLIVGAGPVGLMTALCLADAGIQVQIIDQEEHTAGRSYACALHPRTLELLQRYGLAERLTAAGRLLTRLAFYDSALRQAELNLAAHEGSFLLTLPQNALEGILEERLREKGISVLWNHRLEGFDLKEDSIEAGVEKLAGTSTGYIVPHWEMVVQKRLGVRASFLLGADGRHSLVRQRLGIKDERLAGPEFFAVYEFTSELPGPDEVRVVLDEATTNVLWPLPHDRFRWGFQLLHSEVASEFPVKDRSGLRFSEKKHDDELKEFVFRISRRRAPWFSGSVDQLAWSTLVEFEHRLVQRFGQGRCWLVGDAAHQTGPVGMQSMNVGLLEAERMAEALKQILQQGAPLDTLESYNHDAQAEWRKLLGLNGGLKPGPKASDWVRERYTRMLPCLPASNGDLEALAGQLGLVIS